VLQAYCLVSWLAHRYPHATVEVIDYRYPALERREWRKAITPHPPFLRPAQLAKLFRVRGFLRRQIPISPDRISTSDARPAVGFLESLEYDAIVVGSDTVFEVRRGGGSPPAPNIYFLPSLSDTRKISFAASSDKSSDELLADAGRREQLRACLDDFDTLTVRDEQTRRLLLDLSIPDHRLRFMPDPSLLWDFSHLAAPLPHGMHNGLMAGVAVSCPIAQELLTRSFAKRGYRVVNLLGKPLAGQDIPPLQLCYEQFLGLYRRFDLLASDRFHGNIMGLVLGSRTILPLETERNFVGGTSKVRDLYRRLGMESHLVRIATDSFREEQIDEAIERWPLLAPTVPAALRAIVQHAQPAIDEIDAGLRHRVE
jgi:hypothetical protein